MSVVNDYSQLPATLFTRIDPTPVSAPRLIRFNAPLADELQLALDPHNLGQLAQIFGGNEKLAGSEPIAMAYAGHQFGNFVPRLGDGRAILLGEARDRQGVLKDIHLKGAGRTPYSRGGDGRAALGPVLREYLVSEAMTAMRVPTTRSLAAVLTGERVRRGPVWLPGAILTRVATSHVRIGTLEYLAARGDTPALQRLADYLIERHYPDAKGAPAPYLRLLDHVVERQAYLIAQWMRVGFIHGVMNTDNTSLVGETIDFGPCAFLDAYDPKAVFSSIDQTGRYSFSNQPAIAQWNLARLAEAILPIIDTDQARAVAAATQSISRFAPQFEQQWLTAMASKIGLRDPEVQDAELIGELLAIMQRVQADFTVAFHGLRSCLDAAERIVGMELLLDDAEFRRWRLVWRERISRQGLSSAESAAIMALANPHFIPRNHRIEEAIAAATAEGDFAPFEALLAVVVRPFDERPDRAAYANPPRPEERVLETFCGT